MVEMAGIEPASERFVPRTSTSVVVCGLSQNRLQPTKAYVQPAAGALKPLFHTISGITCGTPAFVSPAPYPARVRLWADAAPSGTNALLAHGTRQRGAEQHSC